MIFLEGQIVLPIYIDILVLKKKLILCKPTELGVMLEFAKSYYTYTRGE